MFGNQPAYGNPYPLNYRQPIAPTQYGYTPMAPIPQQQTAPGLIQVTGLEGAKAYPMAPNSVAALFDADRDVMYIKRTDAGGYPTIAAYTFAPMQETTTPQPEYDTRPEFEELRSLITAKRTKAAEKKEEE